MEHEAERSCSPKRDLAHAIVAQRLEIVQAPSTVARVDVERALAEQDWQRITAQLTAFAFKRIHRRSWEIARDLAQDAIAQAFAGGWEPAREPLRRFLCKAVVRLALGDWRRKRTSIELALGDDVLLELPDEGESLEARTLKRGWIEALHVRLEERMSSDVTATKVLALMIAGVERPHDQAEASGVSLEDIRRARRRLFDAAERVATDLGGAPGHREVLQ